MAPEQALGDELDHRADLYAVGIILYRMVTGVTPFEHILSIAELLHAQAYEQPRPPRSAAPERVSARLDAVIVRALAKKPASRYSDALAMAADLVVLDHSYELLASELGFESLEADTAVTRKEGQPSIDATLPMDSAPLDLRPPARIAAPISAAGAAAPPAPLPPTAPSLPAATLTSAGSSASQPASGWRDPVAALLFVVATIVSATLTVALGWGVGG
jgi:serine/threonine-protein kinase